MSLNSRIVVDTLEIESSHGGFLFSQPLLRYFVYFCVLQASPKILCLFPIGWTLSNTSMTTETLFPETFVCSLVPQYFTGKPDVDDNITLIEL